MLFELYGFRNNFASLASSVICFFVAKNSQKFKDACTEVPHFACLKEQLIFLLNKHFQFGTAVALTQRVSAAKLTRGQVEHFRDHLPEKLSQAMARKVWVSFKSMLRNEHVSHLADNVRISANKRKRRLEEGRDMPTPDEVRRLIAAAAPKPQLCMFLKVAALTGLRASELLGLRCSDADLKTGELHVRQRLDVRFREIGLPKSKSGTRTVPFGPDLALALKEWKLACPKGDLDLVFPSRDGTATSYRNLSRRLEVIFKAAHVVTKKGEPKYSTHDLRHFFASWSRRP